MQEKQRKKKKEEPLVSHSNFEGRTYTNFEKGLSEERISTVQMDCAEGGRR